MRNLRLPTALAGILLVIAGVAPAQLPQLENSLQNTFINKTTTPLTNPKTKNTKTQTNKQFQSGVSFGGFQNTRITEGGAVVAGSVEEVAGSPLTLVKPSYTPVDGDDEPIAEGTIFMDSVKMARPLVARLVTYSFGAEIPRPDRKPNGEELAPGEEFYYKEPWNAVDGSL